MSSTAVSSLLAELRTQATTTLLDATATHTPAVFTTSLSMEDMVVLDLIATNDLPVELVTLDTGRLPEATHVMIDEARMRYGRSLRVLHPDAAALEAFVAKEGTNAFYRSVELRKHCCAIRKLEPLSRALQGKKLWITGLRRAQSITRADLNTLEHDAERDLMKVAPLANWSLDDVRAYVEHYQVPISSLHGQGYPSVGCAPCTRAIAAGEDERAGRWWWEAPQSRECGLHVSSDGRIVRTRTNAEA